VGGCAEGDAEGGSGGGGGTEEVDGNGGGNTTRSRSPSIGFALGLAGGGGMVRCAVFGGDMVFPCPCIECAVAWSICDACCGGAGEGETIRPGRPRVRTGEPSGVPPPDWEVDDEGGGG
jgi:hypothetical protein